MQIAHSLVNCRFSGGGPRVISPALTPETKSAWESFAELDTYKNLDGWRTALCVAEVRISLPTVFEIFKRACASRCVQDSFFCDLGDCVYMLPSDFIGELPGGHPVYPLGVIERITHPSIGQGKPFAALKDSLSVLLQSSSPIQLTSTPKPIYEYNGPVTHLAGDEVVIAVAFSPVFSSKLVSFRFIHQENPK